MEISSYIDHFRNIVREHPDIKGFYMTNINETLNDLLNLGEFPILILEPVCGRNQMKSPENFIETFEAGFLLLQQSPSDDFIQQISIFDKMKKIGYEIIDAFFFSKSSYFYNNCNLLLESIRWEIIGPCFQSAYGLEFYFEFKAS